MGNVKEIRKAVIFAGGKGTRMSELTEDVPKPLVKIGPDPVLLWVMRNFYRQGIREFYILVGYKSEQFKRFFKDYSLRGTDVIFTKNGYRVCSDGDTEDWTVHVLETGEDSSTGQRLHQVRKYIKPGERFFLTYGDTVSDVDLTEVEKLHLSGKEPVITFTGVQREERFGVLTVDESGDVVEFAEKVNTSKTLLNGGFIACSPDILDYVNENSGDLSREVLTELANSGKAKCYKHYGFWHAMDSKRDRDDLNDLYSKKPELFGLK